MTIESSCEIMTTGSAPIASVDLEVPSLVGTGKNFLRSSACFFNYYAWFDRFSILGRLERTLPGHLPT